LPVPEPSECVSSTFALETGNKQNDEFLPSAAEASNLLTSESHIINQEELNDLCRNLNLSKQQSELLDSRFQQWNLLQKSTTITYAKKHVKNLELFFSMTGNLVYCNDIKSLMEELGRKHGSHEWRLFIDASKVSLKAVLLFNGHLSTYSDWARC